MKSILQKRWLWGLMVFFSIGITLVAVTPYLTFDRAYFSEIFEGRFLDWSVIWLYIHVVTGGIALVVGPFQFWKWLRNKHRSVHRWLGRIYMFLGIFPASITGIIIAPSTPAGWSGALGFSLLGIFWFITGAMALYAILNQDVQTHRRWMIRNFSLTMAGVMLRVWMITFSLVAVATGIDFEQNFMLFYQFIAWFCWVPNLLVGEMIIRTLVPNRGVSVKRAVPEI